MIVDDGDIARYVSEHGVARLFVDLEHLGKEDRQKNLDTWKSRQTSADVSRIRDAAPDAHVLVRINPLHAGTAAELDDVLARGADSIMLPMFRGRDDLAVFLDLLNGRAEALPLVETASALKAIPEIVETLPITGLHIGLNDLHLDLRRDFMFEPLAEGLLEEPAAALRGRGIPFGIGGLARADGGLVSAGLLLGEHVRLGSSATILSRGFHGGAKTLPELLAGMDFPAEVSRLKSLYRMYGSMSPEDLEANRQSAARSIAEVAKGVRERRAVS